MPDSSTDEERQRRFYFSVGDKENLTGCPLIFGGEQWRDDEGKRYAARIGSADCEDAEIHYGDTRYEAVLKAIAQRLGYDCVLTAKPDEPPTANH